MLSTLAYLMERAHSCSASDSCLVGDQIRHWFCINVHVIKISKEILFVMFLKLWFCFGLV